MRNYSRICLSIIGRIKSIEINLFVTVIIKGYFFGCLGEGHALILLSYSTLGLFASKVLKSTKISLN